ncbi:MAG: single-stranded DNA-binding protein [Thermosynechococcus sp. Uc]|uniref:single-stranded DNA-binding protein n=1 Tax=Thermosynechococcus sp. Uc TaxID=3034853 RepID=UPI001A0B2974|nr:single-stranded DNA-binding protein [Thermosynechococcus sp. Uc]MDM7326279.1 single-stranded DNA-binding protein [Thermosynechococcus sp. Uc]HIK26321.1 single-stranded DNA-binding protein [Thermosynechococcus sp. M46_R2017_013]
MNSCVLFAEVIQAPELRYTQENQMPVATMIVQFPSPRSEEPPMSLRIVAWGNLGQKMQAECKVGDRLILEGRLKMDTIDRPEGFKEKRAELVVSRFYTVEGNILDHPAQPAPTSIATPAVTAPVTPTVAPPPLEPENINLDNLPF